MEAYEAIVSSDTALLLARARGGEREAFTELVEHHHAELVRIAYAVTGDLDTARDAAQLAWIKAWQRLPSVREPERLRAWLIAIVANEARQHLRAQRRRRAREITSPPIHDKPAPDAFPSADRIDLTSALLRLEPDERGLLAMRYLAGLSAEEIGVAIGLTASGVRSRLSRLIARLREELDDD
jgi:RNA polymerase sigma-70 factor (ECF subfamily)